MQIIIFILVLSMLYKYIYTWRREMFLYEQSFTRATLAQYTYTMLHHSLLLDFRKFRLAATSTILTRTSIHMKTRNEQLKMRITYPNNIISISNKFYWIFFTYYSIYVCIIGKIICHGCREIDSKLIGHNWFYLNVAAIETMQ